jgi:hypothetical protein
MHLNIWRVIVPLVCVMLRTAIRRANGDVICVNAERLKTLLNINAYSRAAPPESDDEAGSKIRCIDLSGEFKALLDDPLLAEESLGSLHGMLGGL